MRVTTRNRRGDCYICGKEIRKQMVMYLGYEAITFELCHSCARKLAKGIVRELDKEKQK